MSEKNKRAIGYVRVSTEEQGSDGRFGIQVQQTKILDYCNMNNIDLVDVVIEKGSGAKERPLMNELVFGEEISNPPYDCIVVFKNDRIARDMKMYFYYEYVLNKKGIELLCVQDDFLNGVDSSVATLYKAMMQFVAEQERKNITMRTSSGRLAKAKKGGYSGGSAPYGYAVKDKKLVLDEKESVVVKRIFELYELNGHRIRKTQRDLVSEFPDLKARNGKIICYNTVRSIISNKYFYQGLYRYSNLGWVKGEHEPLLECDVEFILKEEERIAKESKLEESGEIYG